ncbi:extracellular protein [Teratosphaeria destructans]|uniref:glycerophosphodiester phosphodiesterase n=1 Tax=Teratosphaeria destructans TaxID=418781 RepID=A0A9W7VZI1_9PEZI|nr:extracellular protein [Teratosphaeria destructans]
MAPLNLATILRFLPLAAAAPSRWESSSSWAGAWAHGGPKAYQKPQNNINIQLGPRPYYLVDNMDAGPLKDKLECCKEGPFSTSSASISHRGAPLMFPEHSREGYHAAARMGAGIIECDVAFTSDRQLVCRHSNCDLHYTTDILARPELAKKCTAPFVPYNATTGTAASATCCTTDITLKEFKSLCAEMEATTFNAMSVNASAPYFGRIGTTPIWRTDMYAYSCAETMSLEDQIDVAESYGLDFTAEAKTPQVSMPFQGNYTQQDFAQQIVDTFRRKGICADRVWLQSFLPDDIFYWLQTSPDFGKQAIYLDSRAEDTADGYESAVASLPDLAARGVKIISPSLWQLVTADNATGKVVPSSYAIAANQAGLEIIAWSFDRSGPLEVGGGGSYYRSVANLINNDGDEFTVIDVMFQQVNVTKMFSDWAAVVTYYANCFGIK